MAALEQIDITDDEALALLNMAGVKGETLLLAIGGRHMIPDESNRWAYNYLAKLRGT
jgi:hypothetical protein